MAFDLKSIQRGQNIKAPRVFVYGTEGIGKSTFAAGAHNPIFLQTEDGQGTLDVARFPMIESVEQLRQALGTLYTEPHEFGTVVLDSADWLDQMIAREVEARFDAKELSYGKSALKQAEVWQELLAGFTALRNDRGMAVILIGHSQIKRFDSPETEPYDRFQPKLEARASALIREWSDCVLFANFRTIVKKSDVGFNKEVSRGITTGERLLFTTEKPAYMAKNRFNLPDSIPLSWDALSDAIAGRITPVEPPALPTRSDQHLQAA